MQVNKKTLAMVLTIGFLMLSWTIVSAFAATTWTTTSIDTTVAYPYTVSLALDGSGNPYITYTNSAGDIMYASNTGSGWTTQQVATNGMTSSPYVSLAIDSGGNPHIAYYTSSYTLAYAYLSGGTWTVQTVDSNTIAGMYNSIALDSSGNPHISYYESSATYPTSLMYASWTGSAWTTTQVDNSGAASWTSLAFDQSGNAHISYKEGGHLKYASLSGSTWSTTIVDSSDSYVGYFTSLAFSPTTGCPSISYYDASNYYLKLATWTGSAWLTQIVDSGTQVGEYTSLAFTPQGNTGISYIDFAHGYLKLAYWTGSAWNIQIVDSAANDGTGNCNPTSLAFNANGTPSIAYVASHVSTNTVKFTTGVGSPFPMPEYAYGALIGLAACFAAVAVLTVIKKRKTK
jgi:hypothetical protein